MPAKSRSPVRMSPGTGDPRRAGLPQPRIAEVVSGRYNYRFATLEKIADAFGVVPAVLLLPPAEKTDEKGLTPLRQSV